MACSSGHMPRKIVSIGWGETIKVEHWSMATKKTGFYFSEITGIELT